MNNVTNSTTSPKSQQEANLFLKDLKHCLKENVGLFYPYNFNNFPKKFLQFPLGELNFPNSIRDNAKLIHLGSFWILFSPPYHPDDSYFLEIAARPHPTDQGFLQCYCNINTQALIDSLAYSFSERMNHRRWALLVNAAYRQEKNIDERALNYLFSWHFEAIAPRPQVQSE